jgi:hypothetical protein
MAKTQAPSKTAAVRSIVDPYLADDAKKRFNRKKVDEVLEAVRADGVTTPDELVDMFRAASQLSSTIRGARGRRDAFDSDKTQNYFVDEIVKQFDTPQKFMALPDPHQVELAKLMWRFEVGRRGETRGQISAFSGPDGMSTESETREGLRLSGVPALLINRMVEEQAAVVESHGPKARLSASSINKIQRGGVDYVYVFDTDVRLPGKPLPVATRTFFNAAGKKIGVEHNDPNR